MITKGRAKTYLSEEGEFGKGGQGEAHFLPFFLFLSLFFDSHFSIQINYLPERQHLGLCDQSKWTNEQMELWLGELAEKALTLIVRETSMWLAKLI